MLLNRILIDLYGDQRMIVEERLPPALVYGHAVRRGNVLVAHALGSNLLESGALLGYLPKLCEKLLGEDLDERGRKRAVHMLRARPGLYVAQERVRLSQAPVCDRDDPRQLGADAPHAWILVYVPGEG